MQRCVRVTGRVQGVGFRQFVLREAQRRHLAGWTRNEADGSVLVVVEGPTDAVDALMAELRRGPRAALVEALEAQDVPVEPGTVTAPFPFEIRF